MPNQLTAREFRFSATTKDGRAWVRPSSDFPIAQSKEEAVVIYYQLRLTYGAVIIRGDDNREYWVDDAGNLLPKP